LPTFLPNFTEIDLAQSYCENKKQCSLFEAGCFCTNILCFTSLVKGRHASE